MKEITEITALVVAADIDWRHLENGLHMMDIHNTVAKQSIDGGIAMARNAKFDLIILEHSNSGINAKEFLIRLHTIPGYDNVIIIGVTASPMVWEMEEAELREDSGFGNSRILFRPVKQSVFETAVMEGIALAKPGKITAARIEGLGGGITDPLPEVFVTVDGEEQRLFDYMPDEIRFKADGSEFIGLTIDEAFEMKKVRDLAYMSS